MDDILQSVYQDWIEPSSTLGILKVKKNADNSSLTDTFDIALLMIVREAEESVIQHFLYGSKKIALHVIDENQLNEWLLLGSNRKIIYWISEGEILFDPKDYLASLRVELRDFPFYGRKIKIGLEFAKLIRRYSDGKAMFDTGQYLDAYNHIVHSLHHLGRLAIIEQGNHPELTVWNQLKRIEPEIYKLYEELIKSEETIQKRLELLFLASDFLIYSYTETGAAHLMETMGSKVSWTIDDIFSHPEIKPYGVDISILLEYLIEKELIKVVPVETKQAGIFRRIYQLQKNV